MGARPNEQAVLAIEDTNAPSVGMEAAKSLPQVAADTCADVMTTASKPKTFMPSAQHRMPAPDEGELPEPKPIQQDDGTTAKTTCEAEEDDKGVTKVVSVDTPGYFRIVLDGTVVGNSRNDLSENTIIAKLDKGDLVQVTEVITCEDIARVRAKVEKPDGWISLKSMKTGKRWAVKEDSPPQDDGTTAKTT